MQTAEPYLTPKDVADRFDVEVFMVRLWCQNGLFEAHKGKGRWWIPTTALENPHPIVLRSLAGKDGRSESLTETQAAKRGRTAAAKAGERRLVADGFYRCPKCKREVTRTDVDWTDTLRPPGSESWKEGGRLKCSHCGYEANSTPRLLRWIDPWYADHRRKQIRGSLRRQVLEEAGHRCRQCGSSQDLQVHHRRPSWLGGSEGIGNLEVLCRECHSRLEGTLPVAELTNEWLTLAEAAEKAGVKPATVAEWCGRKELRHSRKVAGEWLVSDVDLLRRKARDRGWIDADGQVHWRRKSRATTGS